jgi:hypothetical protein
MQNTAAACDGTSSVFQFGKSETILANTADRAGAIGATRYAGFLKQNAAAARKARATPTPERKRSWSSPTLSSPQTTANHGPTLALSIPPQAHEHMYGQCHVGNLIADVSSIEAVRSAFSPSPASSPP